MGVLIWVRSHKIGPITAFQMKVLVYKNTKFLIHHRKSVKEEAKEEAKKRSKELLQQAFLDKEGVCDLGDFISQYVVEELSEG
jgi:hypothetical protein